MLRNDEKFGQIHERINQLHQRSDDILNKAEALTSSQHPRPDNITTFLAGQWAFIEKTFKNRFEKHNICRRIVSRYIPENGAILLDSGSSVDLVTYELLSHRLGSLTVFSNNLFAAMHLIGARHVSFILLDGIFNHRFAATYSSATNNRIGGLGINVFILAATALRFKEGVMVNRDDDENSEFKRSVLNAFSRLPDSNLIIAVDGSKFIEPIDGHQGVLTSDVWSDLINRNASRIFIVTHPVRAEVVANDRSAFDGEIAKFRDAGIKVDMDL
jgi:DeoR/GlpR family transcriptional regulator of sugar metabolism